MRARKDTVWKRIGLGSLALFMLLLFFHDSLPSPLDEVGRFVLDNLKGFVRWTTQALRYKSAGS